MSTVARLESPSNAHQDRQEVIDAFDRQAALRPNLKASVYDAGCYGLMVGIGEAYLPAFALAIGLGEVVSGLVTSVPILLGGVMQLLSLYALPRVGSYKRWIVSGIVFQGLAFIPLILAAFAGRISAPTFFAVASCYWGAGMASGPAWNAWISHVVPSRIRSHYFAKRTRAIQLATLAGFLAAGSVLQTSTACDVLLYGFASIFIVAALARFASAYFIEQHQTSAIGDFASPRSTSILRSWIGVSPKVKYLIVYLVLMQACIQFSGPYFIPYMMKQLDFSYSAFVTVFAGAMIARALCMPWWGKVARNYGSQSLLWIGGLGLIPLSSLWILSDAVWWLFLVQVLSGVLWAAYELAFFLMFLDYIPQKRRADMLTIYNFAHAAAWCSGALLGGWWVSSHGTTPEAYHGLFLISALGRVACAGMLWLLWRSSADFPLAPIPKMSSNVRHDPSDVSELGQAGSGTNPTSNPILDRAARAA